MTEIDVVCPIFHVDLNMFKMFIDTWHHNIPIKRLFVGIGKNNDELVDYLCKYDKVLIIDQIKYKTLGYCLQQLFKLVETEWFIYLHSDVEILLNWFDRIYPCRVKGILESLKDPSFGAEALIQARKPRAYSGAQLIYKKSVEDLMWEDDYVYANEDIILQNVIMNRGFSYIKTPIYHKHYRMLAKRTQPKNILLEWQWKGIIKYAYPEHRLANYVLGILRTLKKQYKLEFDLREFIGENNPNWFDVL